VARGKCCGIGSTRSVIAYDWLFCWLCLGPELLGITTSSLSVRMRTDALLYIDSVVRKDRHIGCHTSMDYDHSPSLFKLPYRFQLSNCIIAEVSKLLLHRPCAAITRLKIF